MLNEPTLQKLQALRLGKMAEAWLSQGRDAKAGELSFDERFAMVVDAEYLARDNRKLARLLKDAELRIPGACIEDVDSALGRGVDRGLLRQLGSCTWSNEHLNVLITGPTGVGKSYLASALGQAACRRRLRVVYRRMPRLFDELALARVEGSYARLLARLAKTDVLILDDLGLSAATETQRHDLLEVMEDRYGKTATVVTSQLPVSKWHEWLGDPTLADAILDRLVHNAYKVELRGPSKRKEKSNPSTSDVGSAVAARRGPWLALVPHRVGCSRAVSGSVGARQREAAARRGLRRRGPDGRRASDPATARGAWPVATHAQCNEGRGADMLVGSRRGRYTLQRRTG